MKSTYRLDEKSSSRYLARSHGNLDYMSESVCCSQPRRRPASPAPSAAALLLGHELRHVAAGAQLQRPDMRRSLSSSAGNLALHLVSGATCHDDVRSGHSDGGSQHASHQPTETDQHDVKTLNADVTSRVLRSALVLICNKGLVRFYDTLRAELNKVWACGVSNNSALNALSNYKAIFMN